MALTSRTEVVAALSTGRPQDLLGTPESEWIDFKSKPYNLKNEHTKVEMAKDVAAFANRGGGLIVCGVKAARQPGELYEAATELTPFDTPVAAEDYIKTLSAEARPLLRVHLTTFPHPDTGDGPAGSYLVIDVEALAEEERYALVRRTPMQDGKILDPWYVPLRTGDQTTSMSVDEVYSLINGGVRRRMHPVPSAAVPKPVDPAEARQALVEHLGWTGLPALFWQSTPQNPPSFMAALHDDNGIRGALDHQQPLRYRGFNFDMEHERAVPFAGGLLLAEHRRALVVAADGTVTAAALAMPNMLGWAMDERYGDPHRINVLTLTELTYEYYRLVDQRIIPTVPGPWQHRVVATGLKGVRLAPGANPDFPRKGAPREAASEEFNLDWSAGTPESDAYQALTRIYGAFGLSGNDNPYVQDSQLSAELLSAAFE